MKLDQQVCSLELAKKLKELGIKQDSLWWWYAEDIYDHKKGWNVITNSYLLRHGVEKYHAYTVAELGKLLPPFFYIKKRVRNWEYWLHIERLSHGWVYSYSCRNDKSPKAIHVEVSGSEADVRAEMLIYLIKNKLINVKEKNHDTKTKSPRTS